MAEHYRPREGEKIKAAGKYLAIPEHAQAAGKALEILSAFRSLEVRDIQFPTGAAYT